MGDTARTWGIQRSYTGFRGDQVESPPSTIEAVVAAMARGAQEPAPATEPPDDGLECTPAPDRGWGWAVQVYAVRSRGSWGIGDLADLRELGRWARAAGASVLLVSPLGAQPPTERQEPCPYYASSRRFRNLLYLRVEEVPGADRCAAAIAGLREEAFALNEGRNIDHNAVYTLKSRALERVFHEEPHPKGMAGWVKAQGRALRDFAAFNAVAEVHGAQWRTWPESLRHPRSPGVALMARELVDRVTFHQWVQFHLHRQLARAAKEIGIIADVPVGFAADGFDAWRWQDLLAPGIRVGAPPDFFFPDGQDWGMPAFDPWRLAAAHFEPFVEALRSAGVHAAGLRLDHVMSMFRLFWIPEASGAAGGVYVRYPADALMRILAMESRRAGAFVIGEDLGLVEPSVREAMLRRKALGYRLLWFDDQPPEAWPHDSVAAIGTHDLPTVAGIWERTEPDSRQHDLRRHLVEATRLPDGANAIDVAVSAYGRLAHAGSRLALASLEDALGVAERPNVPGTTSEWPNWSLALPQPLEEIVRAEGPARIAEVMAKAGR